MNYTRVGLLNTATSHMIYWIGANDRDQNKGWQWSDGSPFFYLHWNTGQCFRSKYQQINFL